MKSCKATMQSFIAQKERRQVISDWREQAIVKIKANHKILDKAKNLNQLGLHSKDALHISCAIFAGCKYFLTTDDKILNKNNSIEAFSKVRKNEIAALRSQ